MTASLLEQLADLPKAEVDALIRAMAPGEANALEYDWRYRARPEQLPPAGSWRVWLLLAGRGFGKTRCGAEWVRADVKAGRRRIALVGPTAADARNVMVEGASGILAISPDPERPLYEPSKRRLTWPNGAVATTYSADEPQRLRGPQHDAAWCDELGAWRYAEAWDMLMLGMRLGADPRTVVTTTPRPAKLIRDLVRDPICVVTRGSSYENRGNLAPAFFRADHSQIPRHPARPAGARRRAARRHPRRAVVARFDRGEPAALSTGDDAHRRGHRSGRDVRRRGRRDRHHRGRQGPERPRLCAGRHLGALPADRWARLAITAYATHRADRIVAEVNNGGDMVGATLRIDRPQRGVYRGPRLARQGGAGRTGGGALPAGPRPSHRHLSATRRPDDKFYLGHRSGRSGVFARPR